MMDRDNYIIGIIVLLFIGLIVWAIMASCERKQWLDEHCEVIGRMSGSTGVGPSMGGSGSGGVTVTVSPGKTGYRCDDGMEYWE